MKNFFQTVFVFYLINVAMTDSENDDRIDLSHLGTKMFGNPNEEVGDSVQNWVKRGNKSLNPEELGSYVEGDILVPKMLGRNGVIGDSYRWKDAMIPFEIRGSFNAKEMNLIEQAMTSYHQNTCIKFIPRRGTDVDYISIQNGPSGCWSSVGRMGGQQLVNLQSPGCVTKVGTVMHELMHSVGFLHEQNREERDNFIEVNLQNVQHGTEVNFAKAPQGLATGYGVGYDYGSIMHYSTNAFSANGQPTIVPKQRHTVAIGQREGFSTMDIQKIRRMYKCKSTTLSSGYKPQFPSSAGPLPAIIEGIINGVLPSEDAEEMESQ